MVLRKHRPYFLTILFHAFYSSIDRDIPKHPYLFLSLKDFHNCVRLLLDQGFSFINPEDLLEAKSFTENREKSVLLTFDDGYYNNYLVLDVLEKYSIKGLFFFVKHQIVQQQLFWWDVYFQYRIKEVPFQVVYSEIQELKKLERIDIEFRIKKQYGQDCFDARNDMDRPMTVEELKNFSKHPCVELGVHSNSHEILTNCSKQKILHEVVSCKKFLEGIANKEIPYLAYPNGDFNDEVIRVAEELNFSLAFTTIPGATDIQKLSTRARFCLERNVLPVPRSTESVLVQMSGIQKGIFP
jgi:peptidoglycan/xylan/chitin deacetylase (PgdA/CDA1 family)